MRRRFLFQFLIMFSFLVIMANSGLAFDWRRVLSDAEKGDGSKSPLKIVLIFNFSTIPCKSSNGYYFSSPLTRIFYSQMYEILDILNGTPNLKAVFAFSSRYIDDVRTYSIDGLDEYLKGDSQPNLSKYIPEDASKPLSVSEWNYLWLPKSLKKTFPIGSSMNSYISIYRMIASSLIGRLIALHSDERIAIAALPYSEAPLDVIMKSSGKEWVNVNIDSSLRSLKSVFGSVSALYPPLLELSEDVINILRDNKVIWTFSSYFSAAEPIVSNGVRIVGVDMSLSEDIKRVNDNAGFVKWISQIHRLQSKKKKPFAIVIDAYWWSFKSYEFKYTFLKIISNDKYLKTVLPEELEYKATESFMESSEVGDIVSWLRIKNRIHLWNRFKTLLSYYKNHERFIGNSDRHDAILNISLVLNELSLRLADSEGEMREDSFKCVDAISKEVMVLLGEDPNKISALEDLVKNSIDINALQENPENVNGVEDEGYWNFAKKIDGSKLIKYVKIVGLNDYIAVSIKLNESAKDYIGKSYCLNLYLNNILYKVPFKIWDGRILIYRLANNKYVLQSIEKSMLSMWDVIEFYIKNPKYPIKFKVELDDSRKDVIIESVPKYKMIIVETLRR